MKKSLLLIFLIIGIAKVFPQYKNFNTINWTVVGSWGASEIEYLFYKNYIIAGFEPDVTLYINGIRINPNFWNTPSEFYGPENSFYTGGELYDYNKQYSEKNIKKDTKEEMVKELRSPDFYPIIFRYYNNSQEYIQKKFYYNLVINLSGLIDSVNKYGIDDAIDICNNMDKDDLSIFRNLLFAIHKYKFQNQKWVEFFFPVS